MRLSFSAECKKELCRTGTEKACCLLAELYGLYASMGSLSLLGKGRLSLQFSGESMAVCRRVYRLLQRRYEITPQLHYTDHARFGGRRCCIITIGPNDSPKLLCDLGMAVLSGGELRLVSPAPKCAVRRLCCAKAFLRGLFLGGGTVSAPEDSVHLELPCPQEDVKQTAAKSMQRLGFPIHYSSRHEHEYMYLKQNEQVTELLRQLGAPLAAAQMEETHIRRQVVTKVRRAMNCDSANMKKTVEAGDKQLLAIRRLEEAGAFPSLPPALYEIAKKRLEAPEATLTELGQMLDPPVGKSGVNHRLRRLMALAEEESPNETKTD